MEKGKHQNHWYNRITALSPASLFLFRVLVLDFYPLPRSSLRCCRRNQHRHCEAFIVTVPQPSHAFDIRTKSSAYLLFDKTELLTEATPSSSLVHNNGEVQHAAQTAAYDSEYSTHHIYDEYIIQWRGEGAEGYSDALRQLEFTSAFRAEMRDYLLLRSINNPNSKIDYNYEDYDIQFHFQNALSYSGPILDREYLFSLSSVSTSISSSSSPSSSTFSSAYDNNNPNSHVQFQRQTSNIPHLLQVQAYESVMQYVTILLRRRPFTNACSIDAATPGTMLELPSTIVNEIFIAAVHRCSLIRTAFQIVAGGRGTTMDEHSYESLATEALQKHAFDDMILNEGINANATWSIRLRRYGPMELVDAKQQKNQQQQSSSIKRPPQQARYGKNTRSPLTDERRAILSMAELVKLFRGKVHLENPMCSIYVLEGLQPIRRSWNSGYDAMDDIFTTIEYSNIAEKRISSKFLARVVAQGPKTSIYAPNTRICITTTPLCPIATFTLCNVAQLQRQGNFTILDPFAGSCATLLAASHIALLPTSFPYGGGRGGGGCRSVAIEVAHNGYVNRDDILKDFSHRSLPPPLEIIRGNCFSPEIRHKARLAIGGGSFDAIVTDPPYGIREAVKSGSEYQIEDAAIASISPLTELFYAMGHDRLSVGTPLLKSGGRLVAFVPVRRKEECIKDCLPDSNAIKAAGLVMEGEPKEQVLSDILSRWLVSFVGI